MAEEQLFRTAISGFNKDDVIAYIDGINRAATENQEWFDRQSKAMAETIKKLTKENTALKDEAYKNAASDPMLEEKLMTANAVIEELNARILELEALIDSNEAVEVLRQEKETVSNNLRQACQRIYDEQKKNEQLTLALEELRKQQVEPKTVIDTELTDELTAQVASLSAQLEEARAQLAEPSGYKEELAAVEAQAARQIEELTAQNRQLSSRITLLQAQANANAQTARINASGIYSSFGNSAEQEKNLERIRILEEQLRKVEMENDKLKKNAEVSREELQILTDKARLYDDIKNNVAKIVEDARRKAADMIKDAEISSRETMDEGLSVLSQMQRRIRNMQDEIEDARRVYNDASLGMMSMLNSLGDSISITDNHLISILGPQDNK